MQNPDASPRFRHPPWGRPEDAAPLAKFPLRERVQVILAQQPWSSVSNLAGRLDVSEPDVYKTCHELEKANLIAGRDIGVTRRAQRRYVLARQGVMHVTKPFRYKGLLREALPLTWQMTEDGVARMLLWLPMIETLYETLPSFWTGGLAKPFQWRSTYPDPSCSSLVWMGVPTLTEVTWLSRGRLHAVARWRFERCPGPPKYYCLPFFWVGLLPQEDYQSRSLRLGSEFIRCQHGPRDAIWWDIEPPITAISTDGFAAFRSGSAYGDDVQIGAVDTTGTLVWSAEASHSEWTLGEKSPQARSIGHPETATIGEGPDLVTLRGVREYRILGFVSEFRAATQANLTKAFHMSGSSVRSAIESLTERGLVTIVEHEERHLYVTQRCREMLAARDRVDVDRLVEVTYLDPEGEDAVRERHHDEAVAQVAAAFQGAGMPVVAGWRWVVSWEDGQLVPDLWGRVPVPGREEAIWVPVELEFSARSRKRIEERKLRSYRLARVRLGRDFPILVITGEEAAARLFDDLAGDLTILTAPLKAFLTGVWEGPESVWLRGGRPVGLSDIAGEYLLHLRQQTGRSLDYSKPSPEVWGKFLEEELVWSAPWAEGIDREMPSITPQPKVEMGRVLNEDQPVSARIPPTPSPAPSVGEAAAQDRVPRAEPAPRASSEDRAQQRRAALRSINHLIDVADQIAEMRLQRTGLTDAKRLCLIRVRAIINYGAGKQLGVDEDTLAKLVQRCLTLEDQHKDRSGNVLWWATTSPTNTNPKAAFRDTLREYRRARRNACKVFDQWARMVDREVRTVRRALGARTLE